MYDFMIFGCYFTLSDTFTKNVSLIILLKRSKIIAVYSLHNDVSVMET